MLQIRLYLTCDDCGSAYPCMADAPAVVDGAIYTKGMLRSGHKDLCKRCVKRRPWLDRAPVPRPAPAPIAQRMNRRRVLAGQKGGA